MKTIKIAVLAGDGIGPEVMMEAKKCLGAIQTLGKVAFEYEEALVGGCAYEDQRTPLPQSTLGLALKADAVLLGAVGGPKWEGLDYGLRPERALLGLRKELGLFANLRPAKIFPALVSASSLKPEVIRDIDIMVVRELTGGLYFGEPRGVSVINGIRTGINTLSYSEPEITRIARVGFELAQKRHKKLTSVDKANVLECTELWREVVEGLHTHYRDIALNHLYVDNCAMQLIRNPKQFDVIVTENMFGDILSDAAAMLTGSIGMLPSASLNDQTKGMYEPVHGSAPDIAGQGKANPIATILSAAMMLAYSFNLQAEGDCIERAVARVLDQGARTADIYQQGTKLVSTQQMGDLIAAQITKRGA